MNVEYLEKPIKEIELLVVPVEERKQKIVKELCGITAGKEFQGKEGETYFFPLAKGNIKRFFFIGLGKKPIPEEYRKAGGLGIKKAELLMIECCCFMIPKEQYSLEKICTTEEGAILGSFKFDRYKTKKEKETKKIKKIGFICRKKDLAELKIYKIMAEAQNYSREINYYPANEMTPLKLAGFAGKMAKKEGLKFGLYTQGEMKKKGMGGVLAVSAGSSQEPVMIRLEYRGKGNKHIILVGKGITFDSGGISIKPSRGMDAMKYDKTGAVNAVAIMKAVANLKLPIKITAIIPASENMPDGNAMKPGDIITMYNKKTVEVINTDAEGRLILADGVALAAEKKPDLIITMATLTGAAFAVLGTYGIPMLSTKKEYSKMMYESGMKTYERVWELPMWKEYSEMVKGEMADLKNIGSEQGYAGTITAGLFIKEFAGKNEFMHLDIATVDLMENSNEYLAKGPSGKGVRLVVEFLRGLSKR